MPLEEAPDKEVEPNNAVVIDKNNVMGNQIDEPVIVDQLESAAAMRDRQIAETYINIKFKAKLEQDAV